MSIIEKYEKVRKAGRTFVYTVLRACVNKKMLMESAKLLGLHLRGKEIWFDCEEETNVLMDFLVFDYKVNGKNAVQAYVETSGDQNKVENELLDCWLSSRSSLFEVVAVSGFTLQLKDLLEKMNKTIKLVDVGISSSAVPGALLFTRLVPIDDCYMTSGVVFAFPVGFNEYLVRRHKEISEKIKTGDDDMKRYVSFFKLSKKCGLRVTYV